MNEKGIGGSSPYCTEQTLKSTVDAFNLGGVPVFNRPIFKPKVDNVFARPINEFSVLVN